MVDAIQEHQHANLTISVHVCREEMQAAMQAGGMGEVEEQLAALQEQILIAQQEAAARGQQGPAMSEEELRQANPVMMLLRSLLPWVNAGQQPEYGEDGEQRGQQGQQ